MIWRRFCDLSDDEQRREPCEHRALALPLNDGVTGYGMCLKPDLRDCTCNSRREQEIDFLGTCMGTSAIAGFYPSLILGLPRGRLWEVVPRVKQSEIRDLYAWAKTYSERQIPFIITVRGVSFCMIKQRRE